jgi:hypothetical protein
LATLIGEDRLNVLILRLLRDLFGLRSFPS